MSLISMQLLKRKASKVLKLSSETKETRRFSMRDGCLAWPILGHQGRQEKLARLADAADHHLLREISWNILGNVFIRKY